MIFRKKYEVLNLKTNRFDNGQPKIKKKLNIKPDIVKKNGIFFTKGLKNSPSKDVGFNNTKILFLKIGVPRPIKSSLKKKPAKILPKPNKNKGISILNEGSWADKTYCL